LRLPFDDGSMKSRMILFIWAGVFLSGVAPPVHAARGSVAKKVERLLTDAVDEARVKPPAGKEVCFSPAERCDLKLVKFIDSAKKSIDIAIFDINLDQLVHRLLVQSRKVPVRVLVDRRQSKGPHSLVSTLIRGGAQVRLGRQRGVMHHKFAVVDGMRLETGSFNYTNHASRANQENQLYLDDPELVGAYVKAFERAWADGRKAVLD
jgi:phosphatidylserine/phosphatidylglycerophosphate/cardiolipin synthase-like enzyme